MSFELLEQRPRFVAPSGIPTVHFDFFVLVIVAAATVGVIKLRTIGCADGRVVDRASEMIRLGSAEASSVTLHIIKKISRTPNELTCTAFARFEYPTKANEHHTIDYRVAFDKTGILDVNAKLRPDEE